MLAPTPVMALCAPGRNRIISGTQERVATQDGEGISINMAGYLILTSSKKAKAITMASKKSWLGLWTLAMITAALASPARAADENWPTWRGRGLTGLAAAAAEPPTEWSETKNIKWKVAIPGRGTSTPVIWGERLFLLTAIDTGKAPPAGKAPAKPAPPRRQSSWMSRMSSGRATTLYNFDVVCIDRGTGKTLWQKTVRTAVPHQGHHRDHGYASYSPVTDGEHVWASFGSRGVHCLDLEGNIKWSKDLGRLDTRMGFGEGSSPALAGDALIVIKDHEGDSFIVALDKATGRQRWRQPRDEKTSWTTPLLVEVNGRPQVIVSGTNRTRSYDAKTGKLIWQCGGQTTNVVPSPVTGFGMVYCTSGFRGNALQAIVLGKTGKLTGTDAIRWELKKNTPYVPSPLLYGQRLYMFTGNTAKLSCYNAKTGEPYYERQSIDEMSGVYASPVGAADRVYLTGRRGTVTVIKNADLFQIVATNTLKDAFDASPAIIGNEIYLRGRKSLYCIAKP